MEMNGLIALTAVNGMRRPGMISGVRRRSFWIFVVATAVLAVMSASTFAVTCNLRGLEEPPCLVGAARRGQVRDSAGFRAEFVFSPAYAMILGRDFGHIFSAPASWKSRDWETFSLLSVSMAGTAVVLDEPIRTLVQRNRSKFTNSVADRFNNFGFNYPTWILTGFYLTGLVLGDNTAQEVGLDGLAATLIASNVITPSLKRAVGRYRPYRDEGPFEFDSFSGHDSWPSGHSTRAFVTAAVIASHYHQRWVQYVAYGIATMVAFARVDYDVHWASDVLAGAIIGISVGRGVVMYNFRLRNGQ